MKPIQPGDRAPDFTAETHTGQQISLADYRGKQVVVLYFYPMDGTPVCSAEACGFRDAFEEFARAGAVVIGVSSDSLGREPAQNVTARAGNPSQPNPIPRRGRC